VTRTDGAGSFRFSGLSGGSFNVAPALSGWQIFPPMAAVTLLSGTSEGTVTFLAQAPPSLSGQITAVGTTQVARFESLHPYANGSSHLQRIVVPGATRLRLHFQRLDTESGVDYVRVLGPEGGELKRYTGASADFWTDWLPAGEVTVRLDSSGSGSNWGYRIDQVTSDLGANHPVAATLTLSPG
jgi:hypothetical protein